MKKCPYCAEEVQGAAIFCRWCGHDMRVPVPLTPAYSPFTPLPAAPIQQHYRIQTAWIWAVSLLSFLAGCSLVIRDATNREEWLYYLTTPGTPFDAFMEWFGPFLIGALLAGAFSVMLGWSGMMILRVLAGKK